MRQRKILNSFEECEKEQSTINFCGLKKYRTSRSDPFFVFENGKKEMIFGKPICLGVKNLELSKLNM